MKVSVKSVDRCTGEVKTKITSDNFNLISGRWKVNMNEIVIFCRILGPIIKAYAFPSEVKRKEK